MSRHNKMTECSFNALAFLYIYAFSHFNCLCVFVCVCVCVSVGPRKYSENGLISTKLTLVYSKTDPIFTETKGNQQKSYVT